VKAGELEGWRAGVERLAASLRGHGVEGVELAFVLGSGLGAFADRLRDARVVPYGEIDGMPHSAVAGHKGNLVIGEIAGVRVLAQQGRVHLYEGWSVHEVTRAVRAIASLGVRAFVLTNAAGGLRAEWKPGTLMSIRDHIDLQGRTPLTHDEIGAGNPYDVELGRALDAAAREVGVALEHGVYVGLLGPSYETPAEIRMLREFGADAVGMSTVAEVLAAHASGARVAGVSLITNQAAGISGQKLSHAEVIETGREAAGRFSALLERAVPHLSAALRK
jgi:purine-nucleoside phosphorylase